MAEEESIVSSEEQLCCTNCNSIIQKNFEFCPACGQKLDEKLTLSLLFNNTISNYFSVDARFFKSFIPLLFKPGTLPLEFVLGKRKKYLHPAQYYLFISVVFFFVYSFKAREQQKVFDERLRKGIELTTLPDSANRGVLEGKIDSVLKLSSPLSDSAEIINKADSTLLRFESDTIEDASEALNVSFDFDELLLDSLIRAGASREEKLKAMGMEDDASSFERHAFIQMLKIYERRGGGILKTFNDTIPITLFFVLPIFALLLKLLFYRKGLYAHHLVFAFYFFTFVFCLYSLYLIPELFVNMPSWLSLVYALALLLYLVFAIRKFYDLRFKKALWKSLLLIMSFAIIVVPAVFAVMLIVTVLIY